MKKYLLLLVCVIAASVVFAQNKVLNNSDVGQVNQGEEYSAKGLSAMSAFLYLDLKKGEKDLAEKYDFVKVNGEWNVTAFAVIPDSKMSLLKNYGVILNGNKTVKYKSVTIPVTNFVAFVEDKVADYVEIGVKCDIQMDSARYYSNADIVQKGGGRGYTLPKGYCGKDVVVGIVDVGFDYTHRNFWDSTETVYRVKRVWDQNNSGTAPSGYGYGNELTTQSAILAALYSHNNETHGSHVAGIAGGGGSNSASTKKYKGMAPESDLVFVATSGNSSRLYDGITYVLDYADSVGKPCVINLSWGSQVGPHDGMAAIDQDCDYLLDSVYTEGSLIVISAGNDGAKPLHQSKTFSANDTSLKSFMVTTSYGNRVSNYLDIWGQVGHTFAVKVSVVDTVSGSVIASTRFGMSNSTYGNTTIANCTITYYIYPSSYLNGKPNITLYINNSSENTATRKVLIEVNATSGTVHEWAYNAYLSSCGRNGVVAGNTNYTINAWGQGNKQIMVASHNTRRNWGRGWYLTSFSGVGARSNFSSIGPSLTAGKIKPDIAAPGCMIVSSYNDYASASYDYRFITDSLRNGNHYSVFGAMQGTSMAAPACAGILALWLEAYPQLTTEQVKWLFANYSITDNFTGSIPSSGSVYFGRGKIDAMAGLQTILQKTAKPTITNITGSTRICSGSTITLSAPTGYAHYIWNTGDTTRSISVSQIGSYYVRAISAEGFRTPNSDTVRIVYGRSVSTNKSNNRLICSGDQVTLSVSGGTSQIWSTGDTTSSITVSPNASTFYTVTSSRSGYCSKTDTISVGVIPLVTATTTGNQTICQGSSVTLNVSGGTSRSWSTGDTARSITVTPNANTTYYVTISENGKCSITDTITITVQPYVATFTSGHPTICQGQSATLRVSGGTSRVWRHNNSSDTMITVTPGSTTTYYVTSSESGKCSKTDSIRVTVQPYVNTTISSNPTICQGSSATLTVSGGTSRTWNTGQTTQSITVTPSQTTTYTVTSSQTGKCSTTDTVVVTVQPYVATLTSGHPTICLGQSATLRVSGGTSQTWSTGDTTSSITVTPNTTTRYYIISRESGKCPKTDSIIVTVYTYVVTSISSDTTVCPGSPVNLSVSGGRTRLWSTGDTASTIVVNPTTTTTYTVRSSRGGYCATTDSVTVSMMPYVATTITPDTSICTGSSITLAVNGGDSWLWSNGATTSTISVTPNSTTSYTVTTDSVNRCSKTDTITVTVNPLPNVVITGDTMINAGETATLTASGAQSYLWSTGATTATISVTPTTTTNYSVTGTDANRCSNNAEKRVVVINGAAIADASEMNFKVYPIPAQTKLTVEGDGIALITVYNLLGEKIEKIETDGISSIDIDVKGYAQGVYVIMVENAKGQTGRKTFIVR